MVNWLKVAEKNFLVNANYRTDKTDENQEINSFVSFGSTTNKEISKRISQEDEKAIKAWLTSIDEPEEDHYIIIDKCRRDPEALAYFLEHVTSSNISVSFVSTSSRNFQKNNSFSEKNIFDHCTDITDETPINLSTGEALTMYHESATEQDDRIYCCDCDNLNWRGHCTQWRITNPHNPDYSPVRNVKGRCNEFMCK